MQRSMSIMVYIVLIILLVAIYFKLPFSPLKRDFEQKVRQASVQAALTASTGVFTLQDIKNLPVPVQRYFIFCGYIGKAKMSYMKAEYKNVKFILDQKPLTIDYIQYNFVKEPIRFAFIDSSLWGIPFQGLDVYENGSGNMKGVIAKTFTLFDQQGSALDKSSLVTILAECLLAPNIALQDYIKWEPIDDTHAKASIIYYGTSAEGVFNFSKDGELLSFTTRDRSVVDSEGKTKSLRWSITCSDYKDHKGIMQPTTLEAIWHYPEGDRIYFSGKDVKITYW